MNATGLPPPLPLAKPRSGGFVTVLAWVPLGMALLGVLYGASQIITGLMFPADRYLRLMTAAGGEPPVLPPLMHWIYTHTFWMGVLMVAMSLALLLASWGLLKRREWGRRLFIALLVLGTLWQFAALFALPQIIEGTLAMQAGMLPPGQGMPPELQAFMTVAMWLSGLAAVVFAGIHAWLIWKLCTRRVREEFVPL